VVTHMTQHFNRFSERTKRRALRHAATDAERRLWQHLKRQQLGIKFRRQHSVDAYVVDFYAPGVRLAVEIDGDSHFPPTARMYDQERTSHLERFGIAILRFTNRDVRTNLEAVLLSIAEAVKRRRETTP